jgi:hypothetical protein
MAQFRIGPRDKDGNRVLTCERHGGKHSPIGRGVTVMRPGEIEEALLVALGAAQTRWQQLVLPMVAQVKLEEDE